MILKIDVISTSFIWLLAFWFNTIPSMMKTQVCQRIHELCQLKTAEYKIFMQRQGEFSFEFDEKGWSFTELGLWPLWMQQKLHQQKKQQQSSQLLIWRLLALSRTALQSPAKSKAGAHHDHASSRQKRKEKKLQSIFHNNPLHSSQSAAVQEFPSYNLKEF